MKIFFTLLMRAKPATQIITRRHEDTKKTCFLLALLSRKALKVLIVLSWNSLFLSDVMAQEKFGFLDVDLRIMPNQCKYFFRCTASNTTATGVSIPFAKRFMADDNSFDFVELQDRHRRRLSIGRFRLSGGIFHCSKLMLHAGKPHEYWLIME